MLLNNVVAKDTSSAKNNRSVTLFKIYQFHVILVGFIKIERGKDGTHRLELAAWRRETASFLDDLEFSDFCLSWRLRC